MEILRYSDAARKIGVTKITLYRWSTQERYAHLGFPKIIKVGPNVSGFDADEIEAWLAARAAERDGGDDARTA